MTSLNIGRRRKWASNWLLLLLLVAAVSFRLPPLINARGVNSDSAIVGLQAMHVFRGEWSWFLWGAPYQGSVEQLLIALGFQITGPTALTLMLVHVAGQLAVIGLAFGVLAKRVGQWAGAIAVLPLVVAPHALSGVSPRQWSIALIFAGIWLLDGAQESRSSQVRYGLGALAGVLAIYFDLFALQIIPGFVCFALGCCFDGEDRWRAALRRTATLALGLGLGCLLFWLLHRTHGGMPSLAKMSLHNIPRNARLLWDACLPWALSYQAFRPDGVNIDPWRAPSPVHAIQLAGAVLFAAGTAFGGAAIFLRRLPWRVRRLGALGAAVSASSLLGFLLSGMPVDLWSVRYLGPIVWMFPFALAPAAHLLRARWLGVGFAPYLISASIGGWLAYGTYVSGTFPRRDPRGTARDEAVLKAALRDRGIHFAAAQYWLSYRLTFLFQEDPIVIPLDGDERYPPYREGFLSSPRVAYVFHPSEPRLTPGQIEQQLRAGSARYERLEVAGFTVLIQDKGR